MQAIHTGERSIIILADGLIISVTDGYTSRIGITAPLGTYSMSNVLTNIRTGSYDLPSLLSTGQVIFTPFYTQLYAFEHRILELPLLKPGKGIFIIQPYTSSECETVCTFISENIW